MTCDIINKYTSLNNNERLQIGHVAERCWSFQCEDEAIGQPLRQILNSKSHDLIRNGSYEVTILWSQLRNRFSHGIHNSTCVFLLFNDREKKIIIIL